MGTSPWWRNANAIRLLAPMPDILFDNAYIGTNLQSGGPKRAVLAGGCFWGMQDLIRRRPGVISTRVGYSGGEAPNATYRNHGNHAEAIEIVFDPAKTSYRDLLEFFFQIHDPSTRDRQGNNIGASYRSAIFYESDEQKRVAEDTIADVDASGIWPGKVAISGRPSRSIRITWSAIPPATPAISRGRTGRCRSARTSVGPDNGLLGSAASFLPQPSALFLKHALI